MKKALLLLLFVFPTLLFAQYTGSGYYRISNLSSGRGLWVVDCYGGIVGTSADAHAIQLRNDKEGALSSPKTIVYINDFGTGLYNISSQGTGIYEILGYWVSINVRDESRGIMTVEASKGGLNFSLGDEGKDYGFGYTGLTIYGKSTNNRWVATPVSSSSTENYFGVKPTIQSNGKYYAPFYADFAFKFASSGMKAYTVSDVDNSISAAIIKEVTTDIIPARTPVLIECSSADVSNNRLDILKSNNSPISGNKLAGNFFNFDEMEDYASSPGSITKFEPSTMRVFNINEKGELALSTNASTLYKDQFGDWPNVSFLQPNSAYLPVSSDTPEELRIITSKEYEEYKSQIDGEKAKQANQEAYQRLSAELSNLKQTYQTTASRITSECANVAQNYQTQLSDIQAKISAIQQDLEQKYQATKLNADSTLPNVQEIQQLLASVLESAQKAQQDYEAEQEAIRQQQIQANDAAYAKLSAQINELKSSLQEAQTFIAQECPLVANNYSAQLNSIQQAIQQLQAELNQKHVNIQLTAESSIDTNTILTAIQDVRSQAAVAQQEAIEKQKEAEARKQANNEAFARLAGILQQLKDQWSDAQTQITEQCPLVAEEYLVRLNEVNTQINAMEKDLKTMYTAIALTAESTLDVASQIQAIDEILLQAKAAQKAAEEKIQQEQEQKIAANQEAYIRLSAEISQAEQTLEKAKETIQTQYSLVAETYISRLNELSEILATRKANLNSLYEAVALNAESTIEVEDVLTTIAKTLEDARIAQEGLGVQLANEYQKQSVIYTLQGIRVYGTSLPKGLYIVNGKKQMIK